MEIQDSANELGYTKQEIEAILDNENINPAVFWNKYGMNTCGVIDNVSYHYRCDVVMRLNTFVEIGEERYY